MRIVVVQNKSLLANKVYDLQLLYDDFERALIGKYLDSEDYLQLLVEKLPQSEYVNGAEIYIDGFHSFSPARTRNCKTAYDLRCESYDQR